MYTKHMSHVKIVISVRKKISNSAYCFSVVNFYWHLSWSTWPCSLLVLLVMLVTTVTSLYDLTIYILNKERRIQCMLLTCMQEFNPCEFIFAVKHQNLICEYDDSCLKVVPKWCCTSPTSLAILVSPKAKTEGQNRIPPCKTYHSISLNILK